MSIQPGKKFTRRYPNRNFVGSIPSLRFPFSQCTRCILRILYRSLLYVASCRLHHLPSNPLCFTCRNYPAAHIQRCAMKGGQCLPQYLPSLYDGQTDRLFVVVKFAACCARRSCVLCTSSNSIYSRDKNDYFKQACAARGCDSHLGRHERPARIFNSHVL